MQTNSKEYKMQKTPQKMVSVRIDSPIIEELNTLIYLSKAKGKTITKQSLIQEAIKKVIEELKNENNK